MKIVSEIINKQTNGNTEIINITDDIQAILKNSGIENGLCTVFCIGSTGGITTLEYERGLIKDLPEFLNQIIPQNKRYHHDATWGDGNGHSHLRSALIKTSFSIPVVNSELTLGTWQQVVFIDFDNRPRNRRIVIQIMGK
jgi:secondary thiamine-phosphate synthase enzyme